MIPPYFRILRAERFAVHHHWGQMYGEHFYMKHLYDVQECLIDFKDENVKILAFLHDVLEDTDCPPLDVYEHFGPDMRRYVDAISDPRDPDMTRKERKRIVNERLSKLRDDSPVLIVKAADRLANILAGDKIYMYRGEHSEFKKAVYRPGLCDDLWKRMDDAFAVRIKVKE